MNTDLNNRIKSAVDKMDCGESKKLYLKNADMLRVSRYVKHSLNDRDFSHMTAKDAIAGGQWDTCNGTMGYSITTAHENDSNTTINGRDVYLDDKNRAYILIEIGYTDIDFGIINEYE